MSIHMRHLLGFVLVLGAVVMLGCDRQEQASTPSVKPVAAPGGDGYPLDVCVVSGEELGSMGDPVVIEHEGQEVRFCCSSCVNGFEKEPSRYLAKLAAAKGGGQAHDDHEGHSH